MPGAVAFPKSEVLFLEAINEKVPVYKGKVRLVREITIGKDAALKPLVSPSGEFTVEGEFKYQACDDRVCYIPATIPLKWTFILESHDRQRAPEALRRKVNVQSASTCARSKASRHSGGEPRCPPAAESRGVHTGECP